MIPCWSTPNPLKKKWKRFSIQCPPIYEIGKVLKPRPCTLLAKVTCRTRWIWSIGHTDRGKPNYSGRNLSQCHFVHHKSHMDWPRIELCSPRLIRVIFKDSARTAQSVFRVGYKNWSGSRIVSSQSSTHSKPTSAKKNWIKLRNTLNINLLLFISLKYFKFLQCGIKFVRFVAKFLPASSSPFLSTKRNP